MTTTTMPAQSTAEIAHAYRQEKARRARRSAILKHIFLILTSLVMVYPLLWMLAASLKPDNQIFGDLGEGLTGDSDIERAQAIGSDDGGAAQDGVELAHRRDLRKSTSTLSATAMSRGLAYSSG